MCIYLAVRCTMRWCLRLCFVAFLSLVFLSCKDDGIDDGNGGNTPKPCDNNDVCEASQWCETQSSTCVDRVAADGDCVEGVDMCIAEHMCVEGKCFADSAKCQSNEQCSEDRWCDRFIGYCKARLAAGSSCTDDAMCVAGAECYYTTCIEFLGADAECTLQDEARMCDPKLGLECIRQKCVVPETGDKLSKGDECGYLISVYCEEPMTCIDGYCGEYVALDGDCSEGSFNYCDFGYTCYNGFCRSKEGACEGNNDCLMQDSYCCLREDCGDAYGSCLTYGEGEFDDACKFTTKAGIFEAQLQCRWQPGSVGSGSSRVTMSPLVGRFGNSKDLKTLVGFYSYSPTYIRFIDPETCENLESISANILHPKEQRDNFSHPLALDLDGDGLLEFMVVNSNKNVVAYKWNEAAKQHEIAWTSQATVASNLQSNSTLLAFDVDGDTVPEIIGSNAAVINGSDGSTVFAGFNNISTKTVALANLELDASGVAELITGEGLYRWDSENKTWKSLLKFSKTAYHAGYADFGTPGQSFDFKTLDGKAEIVLSGNNQLLIYAISSNSGGGYEAEIVMELAVSQGGPMTIGDFNNDGLPEIGLASNNRYGVYDPKCEAYSEGKCADKYVMWERLSQADSGELGSSLFDFDGDGQAELVYADQCFVRVYEGSNGRVLFSGKRTATTNIEFPVIADIDGDGSAELIISNDKNTTCFGDSNANQNAEDAIHEGIRCTEDEDCPLGKDCDLERGLCSCASDQDCNADPNFPLQYTCIAPIHPQVGLFANVDGTGRKMLKNRGERPDDWDGSTKYCRAWRKSNDVGGEDLLIYKDRLDRWVSSRELWNQHAYNIINIEDSGILPTIQEWLDNWSLTSDIDIVGSEQKRPAYNSYRLNKQGKYGAGTAPDITGKFTPGSICGTTQDGRSVISAKLCNRGTKPVAKNLPASFYFYDEEAPDNKGQKICTSYTKTNVGIGECPNVGCEIDDAMLRALAGKKVIMFSNEDEYGRPSTVECRKDNNIDIIKIANCDTSDIIIVN